MSLLKVCVATRLYGLHFLALACEAFSGRPYARPLFRMVEEGLDMQRRALDEITPFHNWRLLPSAPNWYGNDGYLLMEDPSTTCTWTGLSISLQYMNNLVV